MAATVSPWAKPGAWALDSEEHEAELLQQQQQQQQQQEKENEKDSFDFPSLSVAAATKQPKKKKGQTVSLAEFATYGGPKPPSRTSEPVGLTHEDRLMLPTGPRERSAEELDRNRLGGAWSFDRTNRSGRGGDDSNSRWSSRGSDRNGGGGGFSRESNRDLGSSRADEVDNWTTAKKPSVAGNGFERRERDRDRGFFDSQSKADESDSWVAKKSFTPSEGRRLAGGGDRDRRGGGFTSSGGADSDFWGKKKEDSNGAIGNESGSGRPRLNLQPRTLPISSATSPGSGAAAAVAAARPKGANPFGEARPREDVLAEKGQDWKKMEEQLDSMKIKEVSEKAEGGSSFGKRSFGIRNGRPGDRTDMSWRKPADNAEDAGSSQSAEKNEDGPDGPTEEN